MTQSPAGTSLPHKCGRKRLFIAATLALALVSLLAIGPSLASLATAQVAATGDERFAGLQWTFARIKYNSTAGDARTNPTNEERARVVLRWLEELDATGAARGDRTGPAPFGSPGR